MKETITKSSKEFFRSSNKQLRKITIAVTLTIMATNISILIFDLTHTSTGKSVVLTVTALLFISLLLAFQGKLLPARIVIPVVVFFGMTYFLFSGPGIHHSVIIGFPAIIVLAGLFLGQAGVVVFGILTTAVIAIIGYAELNGIFIVEYDLLFNTLNTDVSIFWILNLATVFITFFLINQLAQTTSEATLNELAQIKANEELVLLKNTLEEQVRERTTQLEKSTLQIQRRASQLETISDVASSVASLQDVDQLLPYITQTVSDRFGFYHSGIFLLSEDKKYAVLHAANSQGGQVMLARKHQLHIGHEGIVGFSISEKRARIALDVGEDATYFNNPDLPETHSEMALPLIVGSEVIGVLDVQSKEINAFSNEDIKVLNTLANQVAVAIENARLFEQSQESRKELESTLQQYLNTEWESYNTHSEVKGYRAHQTGLEEIEPTTLQKNSKTNKNSFQHQFPVKLRDVIIGYLKINLDKPIEDYSEDETDIIQSTIDRFAFAMENARLIETTSRRASREHTVSEITTKIRETNDPQTMIDIALAELKQALGATKAEVIHQPQKP